VARPVGLAPDRPGGSGSITSLQVLRALAAVLVVCWHSRLAIMHALHNYWPDGDAAFRAAHYPSALNHLDVGVDIFFCISGYIMCLLVRDLPATLNGAGTFLAKRILRIFPPYWVFTALVIAAFALSAGKFNIGFLSGAFAADAPRILGSLLLLPQGNAPVLGVGWTLIHEFLFYVLCTVSVLTGVNRRLPQVLAGLSLAAVALGLLNITLGHGYVLSPFIIEFMFGALAFRVGGKLSRVAPWVQLAAALVVYLAVSLALDAHPELATSSVMRSVGFGAVGFLFITGLGPAEHRYGWLKSAFGVLLIRIGNASYTLYLSHWFVLSALGKLLKFMPNLPIAVLALWQGACIAAAIAIALRLAEHGELPLHRRLVAWFDEAAQRRQASRPRAAPCALP
jgi:exopolysaccharide production protein ExoZ